MGNILNSCFFFFIKVNQDFCLLFSRGTSSKLLEMWDTTFKAKIIEEAIGLTSTAVVRSLLLSANNQRDSEHCSGNVIFSTSFICVFL